MHVTGWLAVDWLGDKAWRRGRMMGGTSEGEAPMDFRLRAGLLLVGSLAFFCMAIAQQSVPSSAESQNPAEQAQVPRPMTASARLAAARTVYLVQGGGNSIPFNIISSAFESWPRYTMVESRQKADLIVEISAPEDSTGVSVGSTTIPDSAHPEARSAASRNLNNTSVRMFVLDPRTGLSLWSGSENPHNAMKKRAREDNLVEAAQKLFARFHDHMEPPAKESTPSK